jgi:hypothetical protein
LNSINFIEEYALYANKNHFYQKLKQNYQKMLYSLKFLINYIWSEQTFLKSKIISEKIIDTCMKILNDFSENINKNFDHITKSIHLDILQ